MVADVVDYDRVESGEFRSGMYFGIWGLRDQNSEALAIAGVGWVLTGFVLSGECRSNSHILIWDPLVLRAHSPRCDPDHFAAADLVSHHP